MEKLMPVGELWKKSFMLYGQKFSTIFMLGLVPFVSLLVILVIGIPTAILVVENHSEPLLNKLLMFSPLLLIICFIIAIIFILFSISLFCMIKEGNNQAKVKNLLKTAWHSFGSYTWIKFLQGIITVAGLLLFIVPGILFLIWYSMALYVFFFENLKGIQALSRSKELVKGYWWAVFLRFVLIALLFGIMGNIPRIGILLNIFLFIPFAIIYSYCIYGDLKRIKSGLV